MLYSTSRGSLLQYASTFTAASDSTSSNIPADNSKPENTEGKEALTLPFTPKRVDSLLRISWVMNLSQATPGGYHVATGLFKDSEVYALAATVDSNDDNSASRWTVHGYFEEVAGSTSEKNIQNSLRWK